MRRVLCLILVVLSVFFAVSAEETGVVEEYTNIRVKEVSFDQIYQAVEEGNVDRLLFPTGMEIPTKYFDLLMFRDGTGDSLRVPSYTYQYLCTNWPSEDGTYTVAEVRSVVILYSLFEMSYNAKHFASDIDMISLTSLQEDTAFRFDGVTTNAICLPNENLKNLLNNYRELLEIPLLRNRDFRNHMDYFLFLYPPSIEFLLSMDVDFSWIHYANAEPQVSEQQSVADFLDSRQKFWEYIGVRFSPTSENIHQPVSEQLGVSSAVSDIVSVSPDEGLEVVIDESSLEEKVDAKQYLDAVKNTLFPQSGQVKWDVIATSANDVELEHKVSLFDILLAISVIFILVVIVIFWIRTFRSSKSKAFSNWKYRG